MKITSLEDLYRIYINNPVISKDTRNISKNCIYFALKGESFDGNRFAKEAIEKGAAYAVIDDPDYQLNDNYLLVDDCLTTLQKLANHHRQKLTIPIIAISGSNGKTTTKELIATALSGRHNTLYTQGNYNNHIGVPLTLLSIDQSHEFAVIEMGANHQKEIDFLCSIADPDYGMLTNIGKAHLEGFGGVEGVIKGKTELYRHLEKKNGTVFINSDDELLMSLKPNCKVITYGTNQQSDCVGSLAKTHPTLKGKWSFNDSHGEIDSRLYGEYNFYNILAAICIGNYFGVKGDDIDQQINSYESDMNRSQMVTYGDHRVYLDAYNANPSSLKLAIENFEKNSESGKIVVLGDMFELGEEAEKEHKKIVEQLLKSNKLEKSVLVGDNFYKHSFSNEKFLFFKTTEEARNWFQKEDKTNKAFLLKGSRGMKMESILN